MKTLFLHPIPRWAMPLPEILGPAIGRDSILLTEAQFVDQYAGWASKVIGFERYAPCPAVDIAALRIAREHGVTRVMTLYEADIVRAAEVRARLGLPGQSVESAVAFRDKAVMKRLVRQAGVEVAEHVVLASPFDIVDFVERVGFPVVAKPRAGFGSLGTVVLHDQGELDAALDRETDVTGVLLEAFVAGKMYHVDGLVHRGETLLTSVSRYVQGCLAFQQGQPSMSVQVDSDHPLQTRLLKLLEQVLRAMPTPETTAFHLEVFHTPDDRLVFCEIASRVGGARVREAVAGSYGVDLVQAWVELELGLRSSIGPVQPKGVRGFAIIPPRGRRLTAFARRVDAPGVVDLQIVRREGEDLPAALTSVTAVATLLVEADTEAELVTRLARATNVFEASCRYEDA